MVVGVFLGALTSALWQGVEMARDPAFKVMVEVCREQPDCRSDCMNGAGVITIMLTVGAGLGLTRGRWRR